MGKLGNIIPENKTAMPFAVRLLAVIWMAGVIIASILYVPPAEQFRFPEAARIVIFHVPGAMIAVVAYMVSVAYAALLLIKGNADADIKSAISAGLGLLFTIIATLTGMVFAYIEWGSAWNWDPRETSILMLLIVYAAYFALRSAINNSATRARICAVYNMLAFIVMPYLMFILPRQVASLHPSDTITKGGLSVEYRIVMSLSAIGYFLIYIWLFRYRIQKLERSSVRIRLKANNL